MTPCYRWATPADAGAIAEIYGEQVANSYATFELEPPGEAEMVRRIEATRHEFPYVVAEVEGDVVGFAYATRHRERPGYRWSVDCSIYLAARARGKRIGHDLYSRLFAVLKAQGYVKVHAGIALPNEASQRLHESFGFVEVARFPQVGFKFGKWWDVIWMQSCLAELPTHPAEPRRIDELSAKEIAALELGPGTE